MLTDEICCNCEYYEGVTGTRGCAPCKRQRKMVFWNESCEKIWLISERLAYGNPTNADRIRSMPDEELCQLLIKICHKPCIAKSGDCGRVECINCWLDWLKQECEGE